MLPTQDNQNRCLVCRSGDLEVFLDLGKTALANAFRREEDLGRPEAMYPLRVGWCCCCHHVQLIDRVPPDAMFRHYLYVSSASSTLTKHFYRLAGLLVREYALSDSNLVVDIGCNDGSLLQAFHAYGIRTIGVDPAVNLAATPTDVIERFVGYFDRNTAKEIVAQHGPASLITVTNTFPHIADLAEFLLALDEILAPDGVAVIECHYLLDLLDSLAFDTIYHEHCSYWALGPMQTLCRNTGFEIVDAERLGIHHGQLRAFLRRAGISQATARAGRILEEERYRRLDRPYVYHAFSRRTDTLRARLAGLLTTLARDGCRLAAYGATAKGNTLLNCLDWNPATIDYIVDRSSLKQGLFSPGTNIPIVHPSRLLKDQPDYTLLLAWNFADEILAQQSEYCRRGGRFLVPIPEPATVPRAANNSILSRLGESVAGSA